MAELLENVYSEAFYGALTKAIKKVRTGINNAAFVRDIFEDGWNLRELKQRTRHVSVFLDGHLSGDFRADVNLVFKVADQMEKDGYKVEPLINIE